MAVLSVAIQLLQIFSGIAVSYVLWTLCASPLRHIPGPALAKYTDLWRLLSVLDRRAEVTQRMLHNKYGSVVRLGPNMVSLSDPDMIGEIYSRKKILIKGDFYKVHDLNVDGRRVQNVFTTRDEQQNTQMLKPVLKLFSMGHMIRLEPLIDKTILSFVEHLTSRFAKPNVACDIDKWLHYCAWDVIAEISFSKALGFMEQGRDVRNMLAVNKAAMNYYSVVGMMPWLDMCLERNPIVRIGPPAHAPSVNLALERIITRKSGKESRDAARRDMLDDFLDMQKADPSIQDDTILTYLAVNIIAGSDTIAAELRSIIYHLCKTPEAMKKLQKELDDAHATGPVFSWTQCQELPYLCACVSEGMRIFPSIGLPLERRVGPDGLTVSSDRGQTFFLPPGTTVGINPYVVNRDRGVYGAGADDAHRFRPERWLRAKDEVLDAFQARLSRMRTADLTFGAGKRVCTGRNLALIEIHKIVASVIRLFDVELVHPEREWKTHNAWMMYQSNIDVKLRLRT